MFHKSLKTKVVIYKYLQEIFLRHSIGREIKYVEAEILLMKMRYPKKLVHPILNDMFNKNYLRRINKEKIEILQEKNKIMPYLNM